MYYGPGWISKSRGGNKKQGNEILYLKSSENIKILEYTLPYFCARKNEITRLTAWMHECCNTVTATVTVTLQSIYLRIQSTINNIITGILTTVSYRRNTIHNNLNWRWREIRFAWRGFLVLYSIELTWYDMTTVTRIRMWVALNWHPTRHGNETKRNSSTVLIDISQIEKTS